MSDQELKSFKSSREEGLPLHFHISLPPNYEHTAPNDAIMLKVDAVLDGVEMPPEELNPEGLYRLKAGHFKAAKYLEDWCQGPPLKGLVVLTRDQLKRLLRSLVNQPVVFRPDKGEGSLRWRKGRIPSVHDFLKKEEAEGEESQVAKEVRKKFDENGEPVERMEVDGSTQFLAIKLPSKNSPIYEEVLNILKTNGFKLEPSNQKWWLRDQHKTLNFLAYHWRKMKGVYHAKFTPSFKKKTKSLHFAEILSKITEGIEEYTIRLDVDAGGANESTLRQHVARGQLYFQSPKKGIILVEPERMEKLELVQRALSGEADRGFAPTFMKRLSYPQLVDTENLLEGLVDNFESPESWKAKSRALRDISRLKAPGIEKDLDKRLRGYQRVGAAWLWHLYQNRLGGVLADEMGLGKTVQALAFMQCVIKQAKEAKEIAGPDACCLVVCPASLVENWRREAKMFTPDLRVFCHHGFDRLNTRKDFEGLDLVITSYGTMARDAYLLKEVEFATIIADEAQHIKNKRTVNAQALRSLSSRGRFLLTGTPLENSLEDIRSLFEFLMPGYLTPVPPVVKREDRAWFDERLKAQVSPYILRRSKVLVAPELPDKIEQVIYCEMEEAQAEMYKSYQEETEREIFEMELAGVSENKIRFAAWSQLLRLRQVCADPRILDEMKSGKDSAKLKAFKEVLQEAIDGGHRILVFSQFVTLLQLLRYELDKEEMPYCYIDGKTKDRLGECDKFNNNDNIPVFLISLKAGGSGLNLTGANMVMHYDPWWNPAVEAQATDRAHRIGQKRVVTSMKLIMSNTVEEKVLELQKSKAHLLKDILEASDAANSSVGLDDIKELIGYKREKPVLVDKSKAKPKVKAKSKVKAEPKAKPRAKAKAEPKLKKGEKIG